LSQIGTKARVTFVSKCKGKQTYLLLDTVKVVEVEATLDMAEELDKLGVLEGFDELDMLGELEGLEGLDGLDGLDELNVLDELGELDVLGELDELEGLEELDALDGLDALDVLAVLEELEVVVGFDVEELEVLLVEVVIPVLELLELDVETPALKSGTVISFEFKFNSPVMAMARPSRTTPAAKEVSILEMIVPEI
jgi:hypothetical protein